MHVLGYKRNEMVAVQLGLVGSYCLPSPLYGCEVWQTRADDARSASVAWNNCFRKIFNACWTESVRPLLFFCSCLPLTFIIHQRRLLNWRNVCCLTVYYCRPWPDVVMITLALCDIYKLTAKNLVDSPKHLVKELFWREFERSYILWQRIVLEFYVLICVWLCFDFMCFYVLLLRRNKRWMDGWITVSF